MANAVLSGEFIYSRLATDPDLAELVEIFVEEIPARVAKMQQRAQAQDWEGLRRLAHQIKGAAGSYGFAEITPQAALLETNLKEAHPEEVIFANLYELVDMCGRIRSGLPA